MAFHNIGFSVVKHQKNPLILWTRRFKYIKNNNNKVSSVLVTHSTSKNVFGSVARYWLEDNKCYSTWFITWSRGYNIFSRVRSVHEKPLTMNLHQLFHSQIAPHFQHWACSVLSDRISWRLIVDMFWYIFRFIHPLQSVVNDNNSLFFPRLFSFWHLGLVPLSWSLLLRDLHSFSPT